MYYSIRNVSFSKSFTYVLNGWPPTAPSLSWMPALKKTEIEIELLTRHIYMLMKMELEKEQQNILLKITSKIMMQLLDIKHGLILKKST